MANKRRLKKEIHMLCGDIAAEALLARHFISNSDREALNAVINEAAELQCSTLKLSTFAFDKSPRDFESKAAYRKARSAYFAKAYGKLREEFLKKAEETVGKLNAALPKIATQDK